MDYVTRQFIVLAKKLRKDLREAFVSLHHDFQKQAETERATDERSEQDKHIQPLWLDNVISKYEHTVGEKTSSDDRHHRVQNSIRWATWCAFFAASLYAGISARLLIEAKKATLAAQQSAIAASEQARHAGEQVMQAHEQFINSIRPIIWVTNLGDPEYHATPNTNPQTGQMVWTYHYTAIGNNLSYNVVTISMLYRLGKSSAWRQEYGFKSAEEDLATRSIPLAPGSDVFSTVVSAPGLTPKQFSDLKAVDEGISIKIVKRFEDSYGNRYYTGICLTKLALGAIQYCDGSYMSTKERH